MNILRRTLVILLVAATVLLGAAGAARAASVVWMPGFPMRAGAVIIGMFGPVPGATEYRVMRKAGEAEYKEIYRGAMPNFTDTAADPSTTYAYKVIPIIGGKEGDPSPEAVLKGKEKIKAPVFGGHLTSDSGIQLRWTSSAGTAFFNLYRSVDGGKTYALLKSLQENSYFDTDVKSGTSYSYQLTGVDKESAESDRSAALSVKFEKAAAAAAPQKIVVKNVKKVGEFEGEMMYEFVSPTACVVLPNGEVYVAERTGVQVIAPDKWDYLRRFKFNPSWNLPETMSLDKDGNLVIAFSYGEMVNVLAGGTGELVRSYKVVPPKERDGAPANERRTRPGSAVYDAEGNLWVADAFNLQLVVFGPDGKEAGRVGALRETWDKLPINERPPDALPGLSRVFYNPNNGKIYTTLSVDAWIKVIDPKTRKVESTHGGLGSAPNQFSGLANLSFLKNGNILVFDPLVSGIKEFTSAFEYVQSYGDVVPKGGNPSFSIPGSAWMVMREDKGRFYFASALSNKVFVYDIVN